MPRDGCTYSPPRVETTLVCVHLGITQSKHLKVAAMLNTVMSRASILLQPLLPSILFALSGGVAVLALHFPFPYRQWFLLPSVALGLSSILTTSNDSPSWVPDSFLFCQSLTSFYHVLWLPLLLCGREQRSDEAQSSPNSTTPTTHSNNFRISTQSIAAAYRQWNNPRQLSLHKKPPCVSAATALDFALRCALKVAVMHAINRALVQPLFDKVMSQAMLVDFASESESLIRRALLGDPARSTMDNEQLAVRAMVSLHWIWHDFLTIETCHAGLAVIFVAILRFDHPEEWPPVYGSILDAWTVKKFWGRYWHKLMTATYSSYSRAFSRVLCGARPGSSTDKMLVAMGVFAISGAGHALVNWQRGQVALERDVLFFLANFSVVVVEVAVAKALKPCCPSKNWAKLGQSWLVRVLGYSWVCLWFIWIVPRWEFPRIFHSWTLAF